MFRTPAPSPLRINPKPRKTPPRVLVAGSVTAQQGRATYNREMRYIALAAILALVPAAPASAQIDARMFRYPAISADKIAFVYAGDIWLVPKAGGTASRLSSPAGEELFPRFSPDGTEAGIHRRLRRQRRRVRDVRRGWSADAPHVSPDGRSRHRLAP